ncbi:MAG: F0F1 ATP synthase subunit delta [Minisyncoccia bacterium]|jgi:F0F1-type ATP synthase delta subunit
MRYSIDQYAKALAAAILEKKPGNEAVIQKNFHELLRRNGEEARAKKILDLTGRLLRAKKGNREVVFESARKLTAAHEKELGKFLKADDQVSLRVNPGLIAGVRVTIDGEHEFDGSLRGKLDKIFAE